MYDNACGLHTYCLNRDPNFFKISKFLVDRFHWSNHRGKSNYNNSCYWYKSNVYNFVGCSRAYNIDYYPSLSHLNTEVNEQANSSISMLKSQLSYMNERNFFNHLKLFLWQRNQTKLSGMCTDVWVIYSGICLALYHNLFQNIFELAYSRISWPLVMYCCGVRAAQN